MDIGHLYELLESELPEFQWWPSTTKITSKMDGWKLGCPSFRILDAEAKFIALSSDGPGHAQVISYKDKDDDEIREELRMAVAWWLLNQYKMTSRHLAHVKSMSKHINQGSILNG